MTAAAPSRCVPAGRRGHPRDGDRAAAVTVVGLATTRDHPAEKVVRIRPIRPDDADELERFYADLSPDSRRRRFFSVSAGVSSRQSAGFCTTDHEHREGFVAVVDGNLAAYERIVGHLCMEPDEGPSVEVAIAVADAYQGQRIGRRLMTAGIDWARHEGFAVLRATIFASNSAIDRLLIGTGLPTRQGDAGAGTTEIILDLLAAAAA